MAAPHERPLSHKQWDLGFIDNSELINEGTGTRSHKGSPSRQKRARLRKDKEDSTQRQQQSDQSTVRSRATVDAATEKLLRIGALHPAIGWLSTISMRLAQAVVLALLLLSTSSVWKPVLE